MAHILIVDDDKNILDLVHIHLTRAGYKVTKSLNGNDALKKATKSVPDLAIVDVMMPEMDGFTLTKKLRELYDLPVILLTAKGELEDKEKGFLAGSDDYIVKPFEPKELLFRVQAVLRRYDKAVDTFIEVGPMKINRQNYEVMIDQDVLYLPLKEFELLSILASRPQQVFTREFLIERIWGFDYDGDDQTLNVHIKRLREKITPLTDAIWITTMRGVGYKLEVKL